MHSLIPRASHLASAIPIEMLLPDSSWWGRLKRWWWMRPIIKKRSACARNGHILTRKAWVHAQTLEIGEYHGGCTHCDLFWTEDLDFRKKREPNYLFGT